MKTFWTLLVLAIFLWCSPVFAEYCGLSHESGRTECKFRTDPGSKDSSIVVSHNEQGWTMTVTVILKEFVMIEGNAKLMTKDGEIHDLEYLSTRRDVAPRRKWKESPVYLVNEALLRELGSTKGKLLFLLASEDPEDLEVKFSSGTFEDIDPFITETKSVLSHQFEDK